MRRKVFFVAAIIGEVTEEMLEELWLQQKSERKLYFTSRWRAFTKNSLIEKGKSWKTQDLSFFLLSYDSESTAKLNEMIHDYAEYVVGRMGIPYREKILALSAW